MARQRLSREARITVGVRRIVKNLDTLGVANMRTLEMKIADSGPPALRVDPHVLTLSRKQLVDAGHVTSAAPWFFRSQETKARIASRLAVLNPLYAETQKGSFTVRVGQTLEIAIFRALIESGQHFVGGFRDLAQHDDSTLYSKEEPPLLFSGQAMPGEERFDFLIFHPTAKTLGVEAKNIREWIYPDREEIRALLGKAITSNSVPILIARRIHIASRLLLEPCGVMLFETYNQLYPNAEAALAQAVRAKENLGYHDVRVGHDPGPHLQRFLSETVPASADEYRARFERYKDLLSEFARGELSYAGFAARVRHRKAGLPEDFDVPPEGDPNDLEE